MCAWRRLCSEDLGRPEDLTLSTGMGQEPRETAGNGGARRQLARVRSRGSQREEGLPAVPQEVGSWVGRCSAPPSGFTLHLSVWYFKDFNNYVLVCPTCQGLLPENVAMTNPVPLRNSPEERRRGQAPTQD